MSKKGSTMLKSALGVVFIAIGLLILGIVSVTAFQLAMGAVKPLKIADTGISSETGIFSGIALQTGLFAILIVIAFILIRLGLTLVQPSEDSPEAQKRAQV